MPVRGDYISKVAKINGFREPRSLTLASIKVKFGVEKIDSSTLNLTVD